MEKTQNTQNSEFKWSEFALSGISGISLLIALFGYWLNLSIKINHTRQQGGW